MAIFSSGAAKLTTGRDTFFNNEVYDLTTTNVYSPGGGVDFDLNSRLAIKADGQFQPLGLQRINSFTRDHLFQGCHRRRRLSLYLREPLQPLSRSYRLNSSRSRLVCARLTGISVFFGSSMRNW